MEYDREDIDTDLFPLSEEPFVKEIEAIDNLALIENGLLHLELELQQQEPSYFRVAREAHLIFYRTLIEALRGTANFAVEGGRSPEDEKQSHKYNIGHEGWKIIEPELGCVTGCRKAWRYSQPRACQEPEGLTSTLTLPEKRKRRLIHFYTALARIQTECFMRRFGNSSWQTIPDNEMQTLEWLHKAIRNEYEHFMPQLYAAPIADLRDATLICLRTAYGLLFKSGNIHLLSDETQRTRLIEKLDKIIYLLQK